MAHAFCMLLMALLAFAFVPGRAVVIAAAAAVVFVVVVHMVGFK